MHKEKAKIFTVMIIPHGDEQAYSFKLPQWSVQWAGVALILLLISSVSMVYSLRQTKYQLSNYRGLLAENRQQQEHILFLAKQTTVLQEQVHGIQALDSSIRELMKFDSPQASNVDLSPSLQVALLDNRVQVTSRSLSLTATILRTQQSIDQIKESIPETEDSLKDLEKKVQVQRAKDVATPSLWPTSGTITSGFGYRRTPFGSSREFHSGLDIGASRGTQVYSAASGVVRMAGYNGGYGNVIFVDHGYGFSTVYAHLSKLNVKIGQQVTKGQLIGLVGSTGASTGPHLHYEVRVNGIAVNPTKYLSTSR
ncbi:MAG: peptidoglycan DD-metalloendopeptidase family protein [Bacillota bacterium]|nr:peptidoglycan DD-metalloendopeptidase family protein [Bacillota bacterium]